LTRTLYLLADGGLESDLDKSTTQGGLEASYAHAGLGWETSNHSSGEIRYGHRFFGDSYAAELRRNARQVEMYLSYAEDPEVQTQRISLETFDPGQLPEEPPIYVGEIRGSVPYVGRKGQAGIIAIGSKTRIGLDMFMLERDFIDDAFGDDRNVGAAFNVRRDFSTRMHGEFQLRRRDFDRDANPVDPVLDPAEQYEDSEVVLRLVQMFGVHVSGTAETGYLTRSGDQEYDGWWAAIRFQYEP
jgi:hypothetical protein